MGQPMWDERYRGEEYVYGTSPNDFLRSQITHLPRGQILCLAEGEGRNAVFLAERGYDVTAVDQSPVGLAKARQLAEQRGVSIETVVADLGAFEVAPEVWDGIVSIFAHVPPPARRHVHRQVVTGLRPGGVLLLEAYRPEQLEYHTGGPPVAKLRVHSTWAFNRTESGFRDEVFVGIMAAKCKLPLSQSGNGRLTKPR